MRAPSTIAIDGPAASGKSSLGDLLAARLGYAYLDTGVMYRAVAWATVTRGLAVDDEASVAALAQGLRIEVLAPTVDDAAGDLDGDELTNLEEYIAREVAQLERLAARSPALVAGTSTVGGLPAWGASGWGFAPGAARFAPQTRQTGCPGGLYRPQ